MAKRKRSRKPQPRPATPAATALAARPADAPLPGVEGPESDKPGVEVIGVEATAVGAPAHRDESAAVMNEAERRGAEHRVQPRAPIVVEVSLESAHNFYAGVTDNVSTGGLFIATYIHPPTGSEVELDLGFGEGGERYHLRGVVSWVRDPSHATDFAPPGCGIRWVDLPPPAAQAITRFVDKRDTILYDDE